MVRFADLGLHYAAYYVVIRSIQGDTIRSNETSTELSFEYLHATETIDHCAGAFISYFILVELFLSE